ncbi:hypothetical protein BATDEDRAFT_34005 [Batrachochytrium dendrobatidis JAM81]|uniref:RGS domain-containing protein n=1 Tax=Batrachochytrium dendrobatidis (strain JAM81 / FGSC 10211) TaxID=684364 RepID=F4NTR9_BATDJ|nr:uncharacterized protein BATDEDRAFT_34005 [Batrachochytrium dendrobatidis JAM81]EGF83947.1 hypothetical protein BATDEDRAFT_34005 [Batrachochytrium dendrobatidis JAM81]|eukprot:XP_006675719.1 hypothetical protein BATDEDRAFT_34005 [Batrachochytrium dendrobatidis JAM81]
MQNDTDLNALARQLTQVGSLGLLKLVISSFHIVLIIICIPLFIRERKQPMIKHRSWTINILGCVTTTTYITPLCCFLPTYLRHYFLLQLPVLQTKLLDYDTMVDPEKYKIHSRALIQTKFLSSELGAWTFFLINSIPCFIILLYFLSITNLDKMALGLPNPTDASTTYIGLAQLVVSGVFLLSYGPRSPKDNFQIMTQFYIVTALAIGVVLTSLIGIVSGNSNVIKICHIFSAVLVFLTVSVDLIIPLQFLLTNKRYKLSPIRLSTGALKKRSVKKPGHSMRVQVNLSQENALSNGISSGEGATSEGSRSVKSQSSCAGKVANFSVPKILADPILYDAFCVYLAREFSMESLLFIEAVRWYKKQITASPTRDNIIALSEKIHNEFIAPNSVNEVNLPKKDVMRLDRELQSILEGESSLASTLAVYDQAAAHIEQMLTLNHLRKFVASSIFREATEAK